MPLINYKLKARQYAEVPPNLCSRDDIGPNVSSETNSVLEAINEYSRSRPQQITAEMDPVLQTSPPIEVSLSALVEGWLPSSFDIIDIYWPTNVQQPYRINKDFYQVLQHQDGTYWLRFLANQPATPGIPWNLVYTCPHVVDSVNDTIQQVAPMDVDPVCHLAAHLILMKAANASISQRRHSTIGADTVDLQNQNGIYFAAAKQQKAIYDLAMAGRGHRSSQWVDWSSEGKGVFNTRRLLRKSRGYRP